MGKQAESKWRLREVMRNGVSPMNPRVKWALLECGHDKFLPRKPRVGSKVPCDLCPPAQSGGGQ